MYVHSILPYLDLQYTDTSLYACANNFTEPAAVATSPSLGLGVRVKGNVE